MTSEADYGIFADYETLRVVGKGGSSTVYKGKLQDGKMVAIKQIDTDGLSNDQILNIKGEIDTMKTLSHSHIVSYLGTLEVPHKICIFLEYCDRGSLRQFYQRRGALTEPQAANCTRQLLKGLLYLHQNGIAHRDIKCANCLLTKGDKLKLADFGASKRFESDSVVSGLKGTPHWMAPEVIKGTQMTTGWIKSDVWSVGCTVVEMMTAALPFAVYDNPMTAMYHIANGEQPPLNIEASEDLQQFIQACCAVDPEERPAVSDLSAMRFPVRPGKGKGQGNSAQGTSPPSKESSTKSTAVSMGGDGNDSTKEATTSVSKDIHADKPVSENTEQESSPTKENDTVNGATIHLETSTSNNTITSTTQQPIASSDDNDVLSDNLDNCATSTTQPSHVKQTSGGGDMQMEVELNVAKPILVRKNSGSEYEDDQEAQLGLEDFDVQTESKEGLEGSTGDTGDHIARQEQRVEYVPKGRSSRERPKGPDPIERSKDKYNNPNMYAGNTNYVPADAPTPKAGTRITNFDVSSSNDTNSNNNQHGYPYPLEYQDDVDVLPAGSVSPMVEQMAHLGIGIGPSIQASMSPMRNRQVHNYSQNSGGEGSLEGPVLTNSIDTQLTTYTQNTQQILANVGIYRDNGLSMDPAGGTSPYLSDPLTASHNSNGGYTNTDGCNGDYLSLNESSMRLSINSNTSYDSGSENPNNNSLLYNQQQQFYATANNGTNLGFDRPSAPLSGDRLGSYHTHGQVGPVPSPQAGGGMNSDLLERVGSSGSAAVRRGALEDLNSSNHGADFITNHAYTSTSTSNRYSTLAEGNYNDNYNNNSNLKTTYYEQSNNYNINNSGSYNGSMNNTVQMQAAQQSVNRVRQANNHRNRSKSAGSTLGGTSHGLPPMHNTLSPMNQNAVGTNGGMLRPLGPNQDMLLSTNGDKGAVSFGIAALGAFGGQGGEPSGNIENIPIRLNVAGSVNLPDGGLGHTISGRTIHSAPAVSRSDTYSLPPVMIQKKSQSQTPDGRKISKKKLKKKSEMNTSLGSM